MRLRRSVRENDSPPSIGAGGGGGGGGGGGAWALALALALPLLPLALGDLLCGGVDDDIGDLVATAPRCSGAGCT